MLVGSRFITSELCALASRRANCILGCVKHSITSQTTEVIVTKYSVLVWPHLEDCVQFWAPKFRKDGKVLKCAQRWTTKVVKGLEGMSYRKKLRTLDLPCCEKRRS